MSVVGIANGNVNSVEIVIDAPEPPEEKDACCICLVNDPDPKNDPDLKVAQFACKILKHNVCEDCYKTYASKICPLCRAGSKTQKTSPYRRRISEHDIRFHKTLITSLLLITTIGLVAGAAIGFNTTETREGAVAGALGVGFFGFASSPYAAAAYLEVCDRVQPLMRGWLRG